MADCKLVELESSLRSLVMENQGPILYDIIQVFGEKKQLPVL